MYLSSLDDYAYTGMVNQEWEDIGPRDYFLLHLRTKHIVCSSMPITQSVFEGKLDSPTIITVENRSAEIHNIPTPFLYGLPEFILRKFPKADRTCVQIVKR
jgi:hypothetical protein